MTSRVNAHVRRIGSTAFLSGVALALGATPALADTKAGVDAWWRGDQAMKQNDTAGATREFAAAVREWQPMADKGDADAQFDLAQAYKLGRGAPQDLNRAEMLYAKAAAQGHMQAADNYGLLLFQRGQHAAALPYIKAAADRGDPRAMYLMGIAHFNAEGVPKDWVRAYALESLAQQAGLPQAKPALAQMDKFIPLADRQRAMSLATEMAAQIESSRQRQLANADLGGSGSIGNGETPPPMPSGMAGPAAPPPARLAAAAPPPRAVPVPPAPRPVTFAGPAGAGADFARRDVAPAKAPSAPAPAPKPRPEPRAEPKPERAAASPAPSRAVGGPYKLQLGAFGVASNVDAQWNRAKAFAEVSGHPRVNVPTGKVTRLMATGFNEDAAHAACKKLTGAGITCVVVRD